MKKLYVGCRVRILSSNGWPELAGEEGVITGPAKSGGVLGDSEWAVAPRCWGSAVAPRRAENGGKVFWPNSSQLEPIVDPGRKVISWEECSWQPEHIEQGVAA